MSKVAVNVSFCKYQVVRNAVRGLKYDEVDDQVRRSHVLLARPGIGLDWIGLVYSTPP